MHNNQITILDSNTYFIFQEYNHKYKNWRGPGFSLKPESIAKNLSSDLKEKLITNFLVLTFDDALDFILTQHII